MSRPQRESDWGVSEWERMEEEEILRERRKPVRHGKEKGIKKKEKKRKTE
jgi:hypothetical protein